MVVLGGGGRFLVSEVPLYILGVRPDPWRDLIKAQGEAKCDLSVQLKSGLSGGERVSVCVRERE